MTSHVVSIFETSYYVIRCDMLVSDPFRRCVNHGVQDRTTQENRAEYHYTVPGT